MLLYSTMRPADNGWWSRWELEVRFDLCWWVVGFHFFPKHRFTVCLGPVGIELARSMIHL